MNSTRAYTFLADMGFLSNEDLWEAVKFEGEGNKRRLRRLLKTDFDSSIARAVRVTVLQDIPSRFDCLFAPLLQEDLLPVEQIII